MAKKIKDVSTKERLLEAAQTLVLKKGFVGTSVDDVCKAAKLTKGSFFHYFKTKDELGRELLERYCTSSSDSFRAGCCPGEKDPLKRVYGFLDSVIRFSKESGGKGCLLGGMTQELADTNPAIKALCEKGFMDTASHIEKDLREAKALHKPGSSIDPKALAEHFVVILQGSMLVSKVRNSCAHGEAVAHYKEYLKALYGR